MNNDYWMKEGKHVCTVTDCVTGRHNNKAEDRFIKFVLKNEAQQYCNKSFIVTAASLGAIRSFGRACGLSATQVKAMRKSDIIGKRVEVDVVRNEDGYPIPQHWEKPRDHQKDEKAENEDEFLF